MIKISEKPFEILGFSSEDYVHWCEHHELKPYVKKNKKDFLYLVINNKIKKINGELYERKERI